jgi:hypothetical protein
MKPFSTINVLTPPRSLSRRSLPKPLYDDANDRGKHMRNVESIAAEMHKAVDEVIPLYEDILAHLKAKAVIPDYLPILVSKRVKYMLQN